MDQPASASPSPSVTPGTPATPTSRPSSWWWGISGVVISVLVIGGYIIYITRPSTPTPSSISASPAPTRTPQSTPSPTPSIGSTGITSSSSLDTDLAALDSQLTQLDTSVTAASIGLSDNMINLSE